MPTTELSAARSGVEKDLVSRPAPRRRSAISQIGWTFAGSVAAVALASACVQPWSHILNRFDALPLDQDRSNQTVVTSENFEEGIAISHYSGSRARLTGEPDLPGAPEIVIVGDSFVEAMHVPDHETMGALIERTSRQTNHPVNVRQYGWDGASPVKYALEGPTINKMWDPAMVVAITPPDDYGQFALEGNWSEATVSNGVATGRLLDPDSNSLRARVFWKIHNWGLGVQMTHRLAVAILPTIQGTVQSLHHSAAAATPQRGRDYDPETAIAMLRMLKQAYGDKLFVLYTALPSLESPTVSEEEAGVLADCRLLEIRCASTGDEARAGILSGKAFLNGFTNSGPAFGHYNAAGHIVQARMIWDEYLRRQSGVK